MGLASHIFCVYDDFSSYRVSFSLMKSLTMMGMGAGNLVCALFQCALEITLVVSVAEDMASLFQLESSQLVTFFLLVLFVPI